VELVVDRLEPTGARRARVAEAVEKAFAASGGEVLAVETDAEPATTPAELRLSRDFGCAQCGTSFKVLVPRSYSFNHPDGWCPTCSGLGTQRGLDPEIMVPDTRRSLREGAVSVWPHLEPGGLLEQTLSALAAFGGFSLDQPFETLTDDQRRLVFEGSDEEIEIRPGLRVRYTGLSTGIEEASNLSYHFRKQYARALGDLACPACRGGRLNPLAAAARFRDLTIVELCRLPLDRAWEWLGAVALSEDELARTGEVLGEMTSRLDFLVKVGLDYLSLHRPAPTLSGGEAQRVKLAAQLGARLTGVMYVLDEPTVGIHPRDNDRMLAALETLRDLGNTVMVVEHDPQTIARADHILDFGPGAGPSGGRLVAEGSPTKLKRSKESLTGQLLAGTLGVPVPTNRRALPEEERWLTIEGARHNNLKNIDVGIPLGVMVCVTGPSGSGKSSLIGDILYPELSYRLHGRNLQPGHHRAVRGYDGISQVIAIDQSPIGGSPRSNPATYIGAFDAIRGLYALLPEAKVRGFTPRRFSFNARGGRCEACEGMGYRFVEMHFLPDVWVECDVCLGKRYNPETLAVKYRGKSISDLLEMSVDQTLELFADLPRIRRMMQVLSDVGLGYLPLGQAAPTLSGGEAQRMKIARELVHPNQGTTLYLLDEPTTGLHIADIRKLLAVLNRLIDAGNSVLVIEHNFDVVKTADWLIDLGPEGGEAGGYLVVAGRPEDVAAQADGPTAPYLRDILARSTREERPHYKPPVTRRAADAGMPKDSGVKPPWEVDGQRWHTAERVNENGESPAWRDDAMVAFADLYRKLPEAPEPTWNLRNEVFFPLPGGKQEFLRVRTGMKWFLQLSLRLPKGFANEDALAEQLALPPWEDVPGNTHLQRHHRISVYTAASQHDRVIIQAFVADDVSSAGFQRFLREAWDACRAAWSGPKQRKAKQA
jgi:excinuclease ABC subunit A